jgi:hypothetical protein
VGQTTGIRPSLWQCLWGVPFFLIGVGFFAFALFHGLGHMTDSLTQVVVPGNAELNLQPGRYTVFLEEQSTVNGKIYSTTQSVEGLECRVTSIQGGAAITLEKPGGDTTYTVGGRSGHSVLTFPIQHAGRYTFACDYGENAKGPEVVVAVGSGVGEAIFGTVIEGLGSFFGGIAAGAVVVLIVVLRRAQSQRRIIEASLRG